MKASLADDIDALRRQIQQRDTTIILLQAELDTLRRENALLRSEIDPDGEYLDGLALGMNIQFIGEKSAQDAAWLSARSQTTTPSKHRKEKK